MDAVKSFFLSDAFLTVAIIIGVILILFIFLLIQERINRKARANLMKDLVETQEIIFKNAAALLSDKLSEYTDTVLLAKVNNIYTKLLKENLFPSVDDASKKITELNESVVRRQEEGLVQIADVLAELFAAKVREYIEQEVVVISSLQETTTQFSKELLGITETVQELSLRYSNVYEQANEIATTVSASSELLSTKVDKLGDMFDGTAQSIEIMQSSVLESKEIVNAMSQTTAHIQQLSNEAAGLLSDQNERTANLLTDAINTMQQSAQTSAQSVVSELGVHLTATTDLMSGTVTTLKDIVEQINSVANRFSEGLSSSYTDFGDNINQRLAEVSDTFSQSITDQCLKMSSSTEACSNNISQNLLQLNDVLKGHISNLQIITQQLNDNISTLGEGVDKYASRFESGMDSSVSAALGQMDSSLAEIVKRLVKVTSNIQEAADALPKAVKSIKDNI
ncbi:MAG: hypothetical protein PHH84_00575 [Oscillospiraceae bacterium]|nr:hypothetical protein [Oscillospiraceae bacterium]MDD4413036.1 hypothetical protein [Oscillospiraceae bacterium]